MGRPREVTDEEIVAAARRCFLERGAAIAVAEIAAEIGVSHTTLFNRFGSKEGLLIAALGPPARVPWVVALDAGPDERPIRDQLVEHAQAMSTYFRDLQAGLSVLHAAGIKPERFYGRTKDDSPPMRALRALTGWLRRAQKRGRLANCDIDTLAATILSTMQGWSFTARLCGEPVSAGSSDRYAERFIDLLWNGIEGKKP